MFRLESQQAPGFVDRQHGLVLAQLLGYGDVGEHLGGKADAGTGHDGVRVRNDEGLESGLAVFQRTRCFHSAFSRLCKEGGSLAAGLIGICPTWTVEQLKMRAQWLHTCYEPAIVQSFEDFGRDDIHNDLLHISNPMLLMTAERGQVVLDEDVSEWRRLAPQVTAALVQ